MRDWIDVVVKEINPDKTSGRTQYFIIHYFTFSLNFINSSVIIAELRWFDDFTVVVVGSSLFAARHHLLRSFIVLKKTEICNWITYRRLSRITIKYSAYSCTVLQLFPPRFVQQSWVAPVFSSVILFSYPPVDAFVGSVLAPLRHVDKSGAET